MTTHRWHIELVEEAEALLPVLWAPAPEPEGAASDPPFKESPMVSLLEAMQRLARRGDGALAWRAPLAEDPIAFLLDATGDEVNVWGPRGELLFSNHPTVELKLGRPVGAAIRRLATGGRQFERRCLPFSIFDRTYLLEVVRDIGSR